MIGWAELIKKFIGLDVIWGARSKKASGIQDRFNVITETVTFTAPSTISFSTAVPSWMSTAGSNGKAIRVMNDGSHPNSRKKFFVVAVLSPTSVQVAPETPADAMVNSSSLTTISGRIWEAVANKNICDGDREGNTIFNLTHKEASNNDGGDVSRLQFDHYHGQIATSRFNAAGSPKMTYDVASGQHIVDGPDVVVDNDGEVVIS